MRQSNRKAPRPIRSLVAVILAASCFLACATSQVQRHPAPSGQALEAERISGGGGYPLTDSVTSLWGAVDEPATRTQMTMSFMIYYRGSEGWHKRKWTGAGDWLGHPFFTEFKSDVATLRAEVDRTSHVLTILGQHIDLSEANVVYVDHVDQPGKEVVILLGHVTLTMPADTNPAAWVLEQNANIRAAVLGPGK